jgi:hypothetical protein
MKIYKSLTIIALFLLVTMPSCDWLEKATDVDFDTTIPVVYTVNETASNPSGKSYTDVKTINAVSDAEIAKYSDKLKGFTVNKITYTVTEANPNTVTFTNGKLLTAGAKTIASIASINLASSTETELTMDATGINELTSSLVSSKQANVTLQGTLSKTPVAFTLTIKYYLTVTANALK